MAVVPTATDVRPERVDLILNQLDQLPTLPAIAARVLQLTTSKDSDAQEVVQLIESDQSLSTKILSLASKANVGAGRNVDTVDKAVILLGFDAIRFSVLSIKVFETFANIDGHKSHFDRTEFWKHSLAVACAAQLLTERWSKHLDPEVSFVAGLLHDIGKVALDASLPKSYDRVVRVAVSRHVCLLDVEQELLGVDHTVAGKRLAQRWQLPNNLIECIWLHHHTPDMLPDSVSNPDLVQIVNLADTWVREQRLGFSGFVSDCAGSEEVAAMMGMPREHLQQSAPLLLERIQERAELLGLNEITPGKMYAEAVSSVNLELSRLNTELIGANHQLQSRVRYLELIHRFNCALQSHLPLTDVCQIGAACARELLGLRSVAVFTRQPQHNMYYVGVSDEKGHVAEVFSSEPLEDDALSQSAMTRHPSLIVAPKSTAVIRDRIQERLGPAPHWMLPMVKSGQVWGGVLFHLPANEIDRYHGHVNDMVMFATALSNALVNGHERMRAERLNEGLVQVNRQLKFAQTELLRSRSLGMIAEMAAGAAHELNNPLAVIAGRAELLSDATADEKVKKDLRIISEQAHRASEIVQELMSFAKPDAPQPERVVLSGLLRRMVQEWVDRSSLTPAQLKLEISDESMAILADAHQIEGMFEELIKNAIEACDAQKAQIVINCRSDASDEKVTVLVEDNGCGMSKEVLDKARDPFFSYRTAGRGRGLGLSRAVRWCEINGGRMRINSQSKTGTQVWIEFSRCQ